jgi:hypothetical protein
VKSALTAALGSRLAFTEAQAEACDKRGRSHGIRCSSVYIAPSS